MTDFSITPKPVPTKDRAKLLSAQLNFDENRGIINLGVGRKVDGSFEEDEVTSIEFKGAEFSALMSTLSVDQQALVALIKSKL